MSKLHPATKRHGVQECENCRRDFDSRPTDWQCPWCDFDNTPTSFRAARLREVMFQDAKRRDGASAAPDDIPYRDDRDIDDVNLRRDPAEAVG